MDHTLNRRTLGRTAGVLVSGAFAARLTSTAAQEATSAATPAATPCPCGAGAGTALDAADAEFDRLYIDTIIPHHASLITLAAAGLVRLEDEALRRMASDFNYGHTLTINELRNLREELYERAAPVVPNEERIDSLLELPGMEGVDREQLLTQLDLALEARRLCTAENPDLGFIDLVIAHHQVGIALSETALTQASNEEIKRIARTAVETLRFQIDQLEEARARLTG